MYCPIVTPVLSSAPASEPVTLAELKLHVRQDFDDDDDYLDTLITAARQWFETALDKQLVTATWIVKYPYFPAWDIELPYPPLQSVTSIAYRDTGGVTQTLSAATYDVVTHMTPGYVAPKSGYSWPSTGESPTAVTITFVSGYGSAGSVPELVKHGIKMLAGAWYENREAIAPGQIGAIPLAVDSIVAACRAYRF